MTTIIGRTEPTTLVVPPRTSGDRWRAFSLVAMRLSVGFLFLWAFLDKTFGLGYATPTDRAWINGGSPTNGFLSHLDVGPLKGFFNAIAGNPIADWLFGTSDLDRGLIGTLLNGYDTRYLKQNLRGHPRRPDEAAAAPVGVY